MNNNYLLSDKIIFDSKPIAVPYNYRISYKIAQLSLILYICCGRSGCSLIKLHMISVALGTDQEIQKLIKQTNDGLVEIPVVRFDPAVNRALLYAIMEGIIIQQKDGKLKLSPLGKTYVICIIKQEDLMQRERCFLSKISTGITESMIQKIMTDWRYKNVAN